MPKELIVNNKIAKSQKNFRFKYPVIFLAPFFICFFAFNLYPILYAVYMSLLSWNGHTTRLPKS